MNVKQQEIEQLFITNNCDFPDTWNVLSDDRGIYFIEKNSLKKRYTQTKNCLHCDRTFAIRKISTITETNFCSHFCRGIHKKTEINVDCAFCSNTISRKKSVVDKSKNQKFFCNKICKDKGQSVDGGVPEIQPAHYKTGKSAYMRKAFGFYKNECVDCGLKIKALLQVHHIDGDRDNANMDNLEIVCLTHHQMRHMKYDKIQKIWKLDFLCLTPRNELKKLSG